MRDDYVSLSVEGAIARIRIERPEKANALTNAMLAALQEYLDRLRHDPRVRVLVFTGSGDRFFSSGFEITEIADPEEVASTSPRVHLAPNRVDEAVIAVAEFPKPTIAALNGSALGAGCELATACDLRIGAEGVELGMPPARIGVLYSIAGIERFIRLAGPAVAKEIFFSARRIPAARALTLGLLNAVVPRPELYAHVRDLALDIAANAPRAIAATKAIINEFTFSGTRWARLDNARDLWRRSSELATGLRAITTGQRASFPDPQETE